MSEKLLDTRSNYRLFFKRLGRLLAWNGVPSIHYTANFKNSYLPRRIRFNLLAVAVLVTLYYTRTRLRNQVGFVDEKTPPEKRIYNFAPKGYYNQYAKAQALKDVTKESDRYTF